MNIPLKFICCWSGSRWKNVGNVNTIIHARMWKKTIAILDLYQRVLMEIVSDAMSEFQGHPGYLMRQKAHFPRWMRTLGARVKVKRSPVIGPGLTLDAWRLTRKDKSGTLKAERRRRNIQRRSPCSFLQRLRKIIINSISFRGQLFTFSVSRSAFRLPPYYDFGMTKIDGSIVLFSSILFTVVVMLICPP